METKYFLKFFYSVETKRAQNRKKKGVQHIKKKQKKLRSHFFSLKNQNHTVML